MADLCFGFVVACAIAALSQQYVRYGRTTQRRVYWTCAVLGGIAAFAAVQPDAKKGFGLALFFIGVMVVAAYAYTPYVKVGGKVRALTLQDSRPDPDEEADQAASDVDPVHDPAPDAYSGLLTATKMWWLLLPLLVISSVNTYAFVIGRGEWWVAGIGLAFVVFLSIAMGFGDSSWGYGVARGQRLQFALAAFVTGGVFAVLYVAAYGVAGRRPLRRTNSMESRAHPRHGQADGKQ